MIALNYDSLDQIDEFRFTGLHAHKLVFYVLYRSPIGGNIIPLEVLVMTSWAAQDQHHEMVLRPGYPLLVRYPTNPTDHRLLSRMANLHTSGLINTLANVDGSFFSDDSEFWTGSKGITTRIMKYCPTISAEIAHTLPTVDDYIAGKSPFTKLSQIRTTKLGLYWFVFRQCFKNIFKPIGNWAFAKLAKLMSLP